MYQGYLLLRSENDFSFEAARANLAAAFPGAAFTLGEGTMSLAADEWDIYFQDNSAPEVLEESRRIAEQITGADDEQGIGECARRIEFGCDVPDPEMEHFEDFQNVLAALRPFRGGILVDPREPCLL